jgi:hypothetical protein
MDSKYGNAAELPLGLDLTFVNVRLRVSHLYIAPLRNKMYVADM